VRDYLTERLKLSHRLEGIVNALGDEIQEVLNDALERTSGKIVALMAKAQKAKGVLKRKKFLEQQKAEIQKVLREIFPKVSETIMDRTADLAIATPGIIKNMTEKCFGEEIAIGLGVPKLTKKQVLSWFEGLSIEGAYFPEWMKTIEENARKRITVAARRGLVMDEPVSKIARELQQALNISRNSSQGLAHTAMFQMLNDTEYEMHSENSRCKGFQFVAMLDRKTTPQCVGLDGQTFNVEEAQNHKPPLHWKCRSMLLSIYIEGVQYDRRAILDTKPRTVTRRDGSTYTKYEKQETMKVPGGTTYNQWMQSMVTSKNPRDVSFAKESLGPKRFDLVASRKLTVDKLTYDGKLRTVKELERLSS